MQNETGHDLHNQDLSVRANERANQYVSPAMAKLKEVLDDDDMHKFNNLARSEINDPEEVLMVMYVAAICMNSEDIFKLLLRKNNDFRMKPEWHILFSEQYVFQKL